MGDTVNLASRLEGAAAPGSVLVSEEVHRHAQSAFEFGPVMELKVKGKENLSRAYELLREVSATRWSGATAAPFVARERELAELRKKIEPARAAGGGSKFGETSASANRGSDASCFHTSPTGVYRRDCNARDLSAAVRPGVTIDRAQSPSSSRTRSKRRNDSRRISAR